MFIYIYIYIYIYIGVCVCVYNINIILNNVLCLVSYTKYFFVTIISICKSFNLIKLVLRIINPIFNDILLLKI